ncbi:MAG: hypothetical protein GY861_17335 [bacterium]|nr:hypothetical protein [bacterium]
MIDPNREEIEEKEEELREKEERHSDLEGHNCEDEYDEMLDDTSEEIKIGSLTFDPSDVLKNCDPTAYRCGYNDWADSELSELSDEITELKEEIAELEKEE